MKQSVHSPEKVLNKMMQLCSRKEYCVSEIMQKLKTRDLNEGEQQEIIDYLIKENFINEARYAKAYCRDKFRFNKWGKQKIRYGLIQKGIPESLIREALDEIPEEEYEQTLQEELQKKMSGLKELPDEEKKVRLLRFASGRGYEQEQVWKIIDEL